MTEQIGFDRLTGIIAFARAASLGSYASAARSLSVSPSAVSKSVQRLEKRLGLRLFTRTTRSLTLTAEGRALHERALTLLRDAEDIEQAAAAARSEPAGVLRVTAPLPIGIHLIAPRLPKFRERYPALSIDLRLNDQFSDLVEEGIDVAIRIGRLVDSRLIARKLASNSVCAFASPDYLVRRGVPERLQDLEAHDCVNVRFRSSGQPMRWPFRVGKRVVEITPSAAITVDNTDAAAAAIAAGGGIGILPVYIAMGFVERGILVPVLKDYWVERNDIVALWPESRRSSPAVRVFMLLLGEIFPDPTPWDKAFMRGTEMH